MRVLVVDDSATYRAAIVGVLSSFPEVQEVRVAIDGVMALGLLEAAPADLVLLDVEMPRLGGLDTLRVIHAKHPEVSVVMVSGVSADAAAVTLRALEAGALDFVVKPRGTDAAASARILAERLAPRLAHVAGTLRSSGRSPAAPAEPPVPGRREGGSSRREPPPEPSIVVLAASAGAPSALARILPHLPPVLPCPVVLLVHLPLVFSRVMAEHLATRYGRRVILGADGLALEPGTIVVAPGESVSTVHRVRGVDHPVLRVREPREGELFHPSIDSFLASLVDGVGEGCVVAVLTGMGGDGVAGGRRLRGAGGSWCLAQSPESCVVSTMPEAAIHAGLADEIVSLDALGPRLSVLLGKDDLR